MNKQKILIIKTGYTEVLDVEQNSRIVSLGDILRTTCLLHKYKNDHVTWLTSEEGKPLLEGNKYISRLLNLDFINAYQLESEEFDKVINFEKIPGICALSDRIRARRSRYGFTFNSQTGKAEALDKAYEVLVVSFNPEYKKNNKRTFQELLFEMVGEEFNGEEYILGYWPKTGEIYDVGFNTNVGNKWPSKAWPKEKWDNLEELIGAEFSISRQDKQDDAVLKNLHSYIDWINSCKILITNDSLGLHLAITLKKKVIALFGPTSADELYFYTNNRVILPQNFYKCLPCFEQNCFNDKYCMDDVLPERVYKELKSLMLE